MQSDLSIIEGEYLRDILDQPQALRDTLAALKQLSSVGELASRVGAGAFRTIVLTGMGSSFHALHPLHVQLVERGLPSVMVETSELVHYQKSFFDAQTLLVAVSQSGQSAEIVRLIEINRRRSALIAITNTPGSPLARESDISILTQAGDEFSVSCKTYLTALMALQWLGETICGSTLEGNGLDRAADAVESYLRNWQRHVLELAELLNGIRHLFIVGRGPSLAAVGTGALIVKESDHFHAEGMSSAAFRHGPMEMLSDEIFVLIFEGDVRTRDLNRRLLEDIRQQQGKSELVSEDTPFAPGQLAASPASIRPILEILPVQMVTLALAALAGRAPGRFELASKVTTTE